MPDKWTCLQSSSDDPGADNRGTPVPLVSDGEVQKPFVRLKFAFAVCLLFRVQRKTHPHSVLDLMF